MVSFGLVTLVAALTFRVSLSQTTNSTLSVSVSGNCGPGTNLTCLGSVYGDCCSIRGFCGSTTDYCSPTGGCQPQFGSCSTNTSYVSYDGHCGAQDPNKQVCVGSTYGSCCSQNGFCGSTTDYCSAGCQPAYGTCGGSNLTVSSSPQNSASTSAGGSSTSSTSTATASALKTPSPSTTAIAHTNSKAALIGGVVGGILGLLVIIIAVSTIWFVMMRRRSRGDLNAALPVSTPISESESEEKATMEENKDPSGGMSAVYEVSSPYGHSEMPGHVTNRGPFEMSDGGNHAELDGKHSQRYEA